MTGIRTWSFSPSYRSNRDSGEYKSTRHIFPGAFFKLVRGILIRAKLAVLLGQVIFSARPRPMPPVNSAAFSLIETSSLPASISGALRFLRGRPALGAKRPARTMPGRASGAQPCAGGGKGGQRLCPEIFHFDFHFFTTALAKNGTALTKFSSARW